MRKSISILLSVAGLTAVSVPAFAHGGGHGRPSSISLPSQAAVAVSASANGSSSGRPSSLPSQALAAKSHATSHGKSGSVATEIKTLHQYRSEIQAQRQTFAANMKTLGQALNQAVQSGNTGAVSTATGKLKTIVTTLAQAVKDYHAGLKSSSTTSTTSSTSPKGLTAAISMFQAEYTALKTANTDLTQLIAQVSTLPGSSSGGSSTPATTSPTP